MPSERDKEGLSVHEIEDEEQALVIAGAFAFNREKFDSGQFCFAAAEKSLMLEDGLVINETVGTLNHSFVDSRHRGDSDSRP